MQESLHTISPTSTSTHPQRNLLIALVLVLLVVCGVVFIIYKKRLNVDKPLTNEQRAAIIAEQDKNNADNGPALTDMQRESIIQSQTETVLVEPSLTNEERAEIIRQMNSR